MNTFEMMDRLEARATRDASARLAKLTKAERAALWAHYFPGRSQPLEKSDVVRDLAIELVADKR